MSILARGEYRYACDGATQSITEPWELLTAEDGFVLQGQRLMAGMPMLEIEASYQAGVCTRILLTWHLNDSGTPAVYEYLHRGPALEWHGPDANPDEPWQRIELPEGSLLFPLLRAATGPLLARLDKAEATVVVPNLHNPSDTGNASAFLTPLLSQRWAKKSGESANGLTHYRYYGGEYGAAGSDYWIDARGIVQRYSWATPEGNWEVVLADFWTDERFASLS